MINNIIFDFGDVFLNLDKNAVYRDLSEAELERIGEDMYPLNCDIETGKITEQQFLTGLEKILPGRKADELRNRWNAMLLDFPEYRLEYLEHLNKTNNYRLFLLSNTNAIHIEYVQEAMGELRYNRFRDCFEAFYLSHEIGLRKPDTEIFEFVLETHELNPNQTLFIDDTPENTEAAAALGIQTWNLRPGQDDITQLNRRFLQ